MLQFVSRGEKMNSQDEISFENIAKDIIYTSKYKKLKDIKHHGLNRYIHIMRVSKFTYKITKFLKLDYVSATRAALLHDYFIESSDNKEVFANHPHIALNNAMNDYGLNIKEQNAIESHMFPLGRTLPKYRESWILTLVDKTVAIYEMSRFKLSGVLHLYSIFLINMLLFGQK